MQPLLWTVLKAWFNATKRDLPWRHTRDPYAIWISEIMLQQTQVAVVKSYFERWMIRFPTVTDLAEAPLDGVIKTWEGLGYYSRARYLHEGAKYVVAHFNGQLPNNEHDLKKIKGLGPYTIGALLSFAFHQKKAAVDGNVLRVLTRYWGLEDDIAKTATVQKLRQQLEQHLPEEEPWIGSEALIELGATICQRKARCLACPLQAGCQSFKEGKVDQRPVKSKGPEVTLLYRAVAVIHHQDNYLVRRGKKGKIMSDLYEFPYFETTSTGWTNEEFQTFIQQNYGLHVQIQQPLTKLSHGFTRYHAHLSPLLMTCTHCLEVPDLEWHSLENLKQLAFSSGHRRILQQLH